MILNNFEFGKINVPKNITKEKKTPAFNGIEVKKIVNFVNKNCDQLFGAMSSPDITELSRQRLWEKLTHTINNAATHDFKREVTQIKKKWHDEVTHFQGVLLKCEKI